MRVLAIVGSPHGARGSTAHLTRIVLEGAESAGAKTETICLKGDTILPCLGCDVCHKKGKCTLKDEFEAIRQKILGSDGLVLGSPNYIFSVSAQLKAFMDRCGEIIHCLGFEGRYGASVVTSGGGDEEPIVEYMNHFLMITGIRSVGSVWATMGTIEGLNFPEDIRRRAFELGERLVQSWKEKVSDPVFDEKFAAFRERMRNLMLYRGGEWPYEYEYWKKNRDLA